jgi:hypothetical protein
MASAQGNCQNEDPFPFDPVPVNSNGTVTQVSTCVYLQEYTALTGILNGATYEFTVTGNGYITLRSGSFDGPVVAQGLSPLQYTTASANDLYAHYTADESCTQVTGCQTNTVQVLLDCTLPVVDFAIVLDCDNFEYFVEVVVTDLGDAPFLDIENDGGAPFITNVGTGTYQVGPFADLTQVQLLVRHGGDELCSVQSPVLVNTPCPVIGCGPNDYTYCYGDQESILFTYQSGTAFPLALQFTAGELSTFGDIITIYDGEDQTAPVLFTGNNNGLMAGVLVISTNPTNSLTMLLESDFSGSCLSDALEPLAWTVQCLECVQPQADYTIVNDCDNFQFFVDVEVVALGSNPELVITNDAGANDIVVTAPGTYQSGPFVSGVPVQIFLLDGLNELCTIASPFLENPLCAQPIVCGAPASNLTYCYQNNDSRAWAFTSDAGGTLRLRFLLGTIESSNWDNLTIYDGPDNTGTVLFDHVLLETFNLGPEGSAVNNTFAAYYGIEVVGTGNSLYMEMSSDASASCSTLTNYDQWEWEVVCLNCTLPLVGASIEDDCANGTFTIPVTIGSTGDGATVNIVYSVDQGPVFTIPSLGVGQTVLGPFNIDEVVNLLVEHENNPLCNVSLGDLTDTGTCPTLIDCGTDLNVNYCPGNNANTFYYYQGNGAFPLGLLFNAGALETCCDRLFVYDGPDENAPELTPVGGVAGPVAGLFFAATNPDNILTVVITTDGSVSCESGSQAALDWTLSCLDCIAPEATFEIVQDCDNFQYFVDVVVTSLGSDPALDLVYSSGADTLAVDAPGTYQVGPFVSGTFNQFTLVNDANNLCNLASDTLVNPICPVILCGASTIEETYCYVASDSRAWAYELPGAGTLRLTFLRGTIESNTYDRLRIFDGPDNTSPILFEHTNTATWNLGASGSAVNNTFTDFYAVDVTATGGNLYMEMSSDPSVQCATSTTYDPWEWSVYCEGCQIPGVSYEPVPNCFDRTYVMGVEVSNVGPDGLRVVNTYTGEEQVASVAGTLAFGPYDQNAPVAFELTSLDNPDCSYYSDTLTFASAGCIIASCGIDNYSRCYGNDEDRWYTFASPISGPITVAFQQGQMLTNDRIVVYNGLDENAPVLYQGNNGGNLTGFAVNSQNTNNAITLRIQSNASGSCADGQSSIELRWTVGCGAVGIDDASAAIFEVYPNPTTGLLTIDLGDGLAGTVVLKVLDLSGRNLIEQRVPAQAGPYTLDMGALTNGQYMLQVISDETIKTRFVQLIR